jgi:ribosomal protein L21E
MANAFKEGDRVQVVDRDASAEDAKSGMFYNHYRGLIGTVQKVYESSNDIAVTIDEGVLPDAIAARHSDIRLAMKTKWLDALSEEARGKLTDQEKDFQLHYSILVAPKDLLPSDAPAPVASAHTETKAIAEKAGAEAPPKRRTAAEIEADEAAYLESRRAEER